METIRKIVHSIDELAASAAALDNTSSLYDAGLSSYGTVELMMALETAFGVEFPDRLLTRATFETISSLVAVVTTLREVPSTTVGAFERNSVAVPTYGTLDVPSLDEQVIATGADR